MSASTEMVITGIVITEMITEMVDISPPTVQTGLVSPSPSVLKRRLTAPLFVSGSHEIQSR
jgi:hypothetical protein